MAKVGYFIQKDKVNKRGQTAIKAVVTINYKNVSKVVEYVKPKHWNAIKQRVNKSRADEEYNNHEEINQELDSFQKDAEAFMKSAKKNRQELTADMMKDFFSGKYKLSGKKTFWLAWEEYLQDAKLSKADKTVKDQTSTMQYFKRFEAETNNILSFESFNLVMHDRFKTYVLEQRKQHYNYLATLTRRLKAFLNWSYERGYTNSTEHRKFKAQEKPGTVVALTVEEFQRLYAFTFEKSKHDRVRDIFCFGCLTGLRISDLLRLTRDNIQGETLVTYMKKVKKEKPLEIPILPQARKILDKYQEQYHLLPKISEQKFNDYIKEAAKESGITSMVKLMDFKTGLGQEETISKDQLIHAHMTRKTFISLAYKAGLDIESIKAITGIRSERTLERYLTIEQETLAEKVKAFGELMNF